MAITAKPTSYTVNTGHSKCPTHLWMFDENTGTSAADKGSGTALNMTLQNSAMWATDGTLGSTIITCDSALDYYAMTGTGTVWDPTQNVMMVGIIRSTTSTPGTEYAFAYGKGDSTTPGYGGLRFAATTAPAGVANDGTNTRNKNHSGNGYDQGWHMIAVKVQPQAVSGEVVAISLDGGAFQSLSSSLLTSYLVNRYGAGVRPSPTPTSVFNGSLLSLSVYENGTYANWDTTWISSLYTDPWQFLNTSTVAPKAMYYEMMRRA